MLPSLLEHLDTFGIRDILILILDYSSSLDSRLHSRVTHSVKKMTVNMILGTTYFVRVVGTTTFRTGRPVVFAIIPIGVEEMSHMIIISRFI
jgi:hypothetical protein